ncbi:MAG TPA: DUF6603 domain-containing protein [Blastocatellia bacterium]|nr:DUF6603 domain-containing protein [Blastocatellia bacterium]
MNDSSVQILDSLRGRLEEAHQAGHLKLDADSLGDKGAGIIALFQQKLGVSAIELTEQVQIPPSVENRTLIVSGKMEGLTVTASFQTEEDVIAIRLVIRADRKESLKENFPILDDQIFSQLVLSTDGNGGQLGAVTVPGLGKTLTIAEPKFAIVAVSAPNDGDTWLDLIPRAEGRIALGGAPLPVTIEMPTKMTGWTLAQADGEQWTFPQLLEQLLPNLQISGLLPAPLDSLQNLTLKNFTLYLDPNFSANDALRLSIVKSGNNGAAPLWQVAPGVELDELIASFSLNINEEKQTIEPAGSGWVEGDFRLADSLVQIQIPVPLSDGVVSLSAYPNLSLSRLEDLTKLVAPGISGPEELMPPGIVDYLADLTLTYLSLEASIVSSQLSLQSASFALELPHVWPIIGSDRLTLNGIRLQIEVNNPTTELQVTGEIAANFQIGSADAHVSVHRYDPKKEWAMTVISKAIPLPSLHDLAKLLGQDVDTSALLPTSLAEKRFILNDLGLDLKLGAPPAISKIELSLGLEDGDVWEFSPGPIALEQFDAAIKLDWTSEKLVSSGGISGSILIDKTRIRLSATRPEAPNAGWIFEGSSSFLPIGSLLSYIGEKFNIQDLPDALNNFILDEVSVRFDTSTKDVTFNCLAPFPASDEMGGAATSDSSRKLKFTIQLTHTTNETAAYEAKVTLTVGDLIFDLRIAKGQQTEAFIATYSHTGAARSIKLRDLIAPLSEEIASAFPKDLAIDLKDALFVYSNIGGEKKFLFGFDLSADISLSNLPLVGKEFPTDRKFGIDDLQVLIARKSFSVDEVKKLNLLFPAGVTKLPDGSKTAGAQNPGTDDANTIALRQGLNVGATLKLGDLTQNLSLPVVASGSPQTTAPPAATSTTTSTTQAMTTSDNAAWFKIQKSLGPVHFERVGAQYKDAALWFLLDASLTAAGLTLSLDGLSIGSPISKFEPQFDLRGLGIDYRNDALEIGGAFLKRAEKDYAGAALIKAKQLTLSALGMYKEMPGGHPSVFVYAVLDYPIGGPSFFFVTGLAAGFGYSRALNIPTIDKVASFSLVDNARKGASMPANITTELDKLANDITPAAGENFLAIGVKFTSFKIIDSFALLTLSFGNHFEMNLLGLSSLVAPANAGPNVPPVAEAQLALKASFQPDKGFLGVQAQLTPNSYILSKDCHLTGGFAFYSWFEGSEHNGDFVMTLGGYHPDFKVPAHYPTVPRLGFNWQVSPELSIKGDAYFALTALALMAGGHLEANWQSGSVHAWFKLGADFLIAWKPYHYQISAYVDIGAEVTFEFFGTQHISVDVGADLRIWGPEFSGEATIHLWIISFTVSFGAGASQTPQPIKWDEFKSSFLPANKDDKNKYDVCSITVSSGVIGKDSQDAAHLGVINPKQLSLATNSVIPSTTARCGPKAGDLEIKLSRKPGEFGIGPMGIAVGPLPSTQRITITRDGAFVGGEFEYRPIFKKVPAGLWGDSLTPKVDGTQFVDNALSGFEIRPKTKSNPGETAAIERSKLQDSGSSGECEYRWENVKTFAAAGFNSEPNRRDELRKSLAGGADGRKTILSALGFTAEDMSKINLNATQADDFLIAPQIEQI